MKLSDTFKTTQGIIALNLQMCLTLKILNKPRLNQLCEGSQNTLPNNEPNVPITNHIGISPICLKEHKQPAHKHIYGSVYSIGNST